MKNDRELPEKLRRKLSGNLSERRYEHTLGVAYTAACLAMRHGVDPLKAEIAGLMHDCAKEFSEKDLLKLGEKFGYSFKPYELEAPQVLHGRERAGALDMQLHQRHSPSYSKRYAPRRSSRAISSNRSRLTG